MALQKLPLTEFVTLTTAQISLPFPLENRIRRLLEKVKVTITEVKYSNQVVLLVEFPATMAVKLERQIGDQTQGQAHFIRPTG
jgi:putative IMPACT (imprinted ancient) family translation regulator